jgi:ParB-like chromosome segregation protein Spo0J
MTEKVSPPSPTGPSVKNETRPIGAIKKDPKNARKHGRDQIDQIAGSITAFGFVAPLVIRPDGKLIGGEATLDAAKLAGLKDIDCRVVSGLNEAEYAALALALNKLPENSDWDERILADTLRDLIGNGGPDPHRLGFSDKEILGLTGPDDAILVREIETSSVQDEFWISVRGPLASQADALQGLQKVMADIPGIEVELSTINVTW